MKKTSLLFQTFLLLITSAYVFAGNGNNKNTDPVQKAKAKEWMAAQKPLGFTENKGQIAGNDGKAAPYVLFKAEAPNLNIWVTTSGLTYQFLKMEEDKEHEKEERKHKKEGGLKDDASEKIKMEWHRVDMVLSGATIIKENIVTEGDITQGDANYYLGHCPDGIFNVKTYTKITIKEIYPGIDWLLYTSPDGKGLKHDFIVHPNADAKQIKLIYEGSGKLNIKNNQIHFKNELGNVTEGDLLCYQDSEANPVASNYSIKKNNTPLYLGAGNLPITDGTQPIKKNKGDVFSYEIAIEAGNYNVNETLVIDPQLVWGTLYGGNAADGFMSMTTDAAGNVYVTGYGGVTNFPTQSWGSAYFNAFGGGNTIFILRFTNTGVLTWSTFYGNTFSFGTSITCDASGNVYVTGYTVSAFPTQPWGSAYFDNTLGGTQDLFILRFSNTGVLNWATLYGGSGTDAPTSIDIDNTSGDIYITGYTNNSTFPTQPLAGAYNQSISGGSNDAFILKFSNTGVLVWATFYGGSGWDIANSLSIDVSGNVYITGLTSSANFLVQPWGGAYYNSTLGGLDAFILRFSNTGILDWATFYGGNSSDGGCSVSCDASGNVYVTGTTNSSNFPTQPWGSAYLDIALGGSQDVFILRFTNTGVLTWATLYGGSGSENIRQENMVIDNCGNVYVGFETVSVDINTFNSGCGTYFDNSLGALVGGWSDHFLDKFSSSGDLLWATYIGGGGSEFREPLAIDNNNNLFFGGEFTNYSGGTSSLTSLFVNPGGGAYFDNTFNGGTDDSFIMKLIPTIPTYTQSRINATGCSPCNGSATITLTCGDPNYNFVWSNGSSTLNSTSTTNTITGLCPGTYTVTVTSNCDQTQTTTFVITGTPCGGITANVNSAALCSGTTPCPTLTAVGASGTAPYTYLWTTTESTASITPCPVTTTNYTVTITDAGGLTATSTALVTINPAVTVTTTPTHISCNGGTNGSATANPNSGTSPYTYTWSNGVTTSQISNLTSQIYTVTITDNKGCTSTSTTVINQSPPLVGQFTKGTANCSACGCMQWILVKATSGTPPYSYQWPDGYTNRYKNQLCPGAYLINITDKNGCSINVSLTAP